MAERPDLRYHCHSFFYQGSFLQVPPGEQSYLKDRTDLITMVGPLCHSIDESA
jgi:hypothetical protein